MTVAFVVYENHLNPSPHAHEKSWEDFAALFAEAERTPCDPCPGKDCPHKFGMAWSPVTLKEGDSRANDNVRSVNLGVIDLDTLPLGDMGHLTKALSGRKYILHTTHSHKDDAPRLRAILALSRPVEPGEWAPVLRELVTTLDLPADPTCKDLSRLYFLPSVSVGGTFLSEVEDGEPVDVDALLAKAGKQGLSKVLSLISAPLSEIRDPRQPNHSPKVPSEGSVRSSEPTRTIDLGALRDALIDLRASYRRAKDEARATLVDNALAGRELVPAGMGHDTALHTVCGMLGKKFPSGTPALAAVEILRRSIVAMGPGDKYPIEHWLDKAGKDYQKAHDQKIADDTALREANARLHTALGNVAALRSKAREVKTTSETGVEATTEPEEDWTEQLLTKPLTKADREEGRDPEWVSNEHNAEVILRCSDPWKGCLRFNEVKLQVECIGDAPVKPHARDVNNLPRATANWLQKLKIDLPSSAVAETLLLVASENPYDPVKEYLGHRVVDWDGEARIDYALERYCGVKLTTDDGRDLTDHVRRVSGKWFTSGAARGLQPGCKVDTVLILEGAQGGGKTGFFEVLGGEFYALSPKKLDEKDGLMLLTGTWLVELSELSALRAANKDEAKTFFTTREDKFRPPYARGMITVPRRAFFGGSYNPVFGEEPATDKSGNRRYWFVKTTGEVDLAGLRRDRDQLWAEAAVRAKGGLAEIAVGVLPRDMTPAFRWWLLNGPEAEAAEAEANERMPTDGLVEQFLAAWDTKPKDKRPVEFTAQDVINWIGLPSYLTLRGFESRLGHTMRTLGFEHVRKPPEPGGRRPWVYRSTEALRARPEKSANGVGAHLSVVVDARKSEQKAGT